MAQAALIQPLNTAGQLDPAGKYVLLSIGMSNTNPGVLRRLWHDVRDVDVRGAGSRRPGRESRDARHCERCPRWSGRAEQST